MKYTAALEALARTNGWNLETKFNKHYCAFKANAFRKFRLHRVRPL
jgi:hypothetical protein